MPDDEVVEKQPGTITLIPTADVTFQWKLIIDFENVGLEKEETIHPSWVEAVAHIDEYLKAEVKF